jgi:ATP-binding cassette subfamily B protein
MPVLRGYYRFVALAFRARPWLCVATAATTVVAVVAPLASMTAIGLVIGQVPRVIRAGLDSSAGDTALTGIALVAGLFAVQSAAMSLQSAMTRALGDRVDFMLQRQLMAAVMAPTGMAHLENPRSQELIIVGQETFRAWLRPGRLAQSLSTLASSRGVLAGSCLILARYRWPLAVLLLAAALWAEDEARRASRRATEHHHGGGQLARRTDYYYETGVTPAAAKEIRVFGLSGFVLGRFSRTWHLAMAEALAKGSLRALVSTIALGTVALLTFSWLCADTFHGRVGLGAAIVYAQAIMMGLSGVSASAENRLESEMALASLDRYDQAVQAASSPGARAGRPATGLPARQIRFDRVTFRYPDSTSDALHGLDLVAPAGESLAIVGANGAGKTTLVKLLCRMYEPAEGHIRIDGADLADLDPASWRRQIAAVFQDYVRYELPARTNVGFGRVDAQDDLPGIQASGEDAGVAAAIGRLAHGWDAVLSSGFENGSDLSGGEWQKVALARALFALRHGARVLILDEPAANLDARAEAQLYERFLALTEGVTTIVISHRFSTVRQASSIAVIRDGQVAEQGSHDELMARDGHYAEMFRLQAARFDEALAEQGSES